jgi:hypothetical protein
MSNPILDRHIEHYGGTRFVPVPPEHDCAPSPGTVNFSQTSNVAYVLDSEWPALEAELRRQQCSKV